MTKAEPLGLSEEDRALIERVLGGNVLWSLERGHCLDQVSVATLLAAARSQPIGVEGETT